MEIDRGGRIIVEVLDQHGEGTASGGEIPAEAHQHVGVESVGKPAGRQIGGRRLGARPEVETVPTRPGHETDGGHAQLGGGRKADIGTARADASQRSDERVHGAVAEFGGKDGRAQHLPRELVGVELALVACPAEDGVDGHGADPLVDLAQQRAQPGEGVVERATAGENKAAGATPRLEINGPHEPADRAWEVERELRLTPEDPEEDVDPCVDFVDAEEVDPDAEELEDPADEPVPDAALVPCVELSPEGRVSVAAWAEAAFWTSMESWMPPASAAVPSAAPPATTPVRA